MTANDFLDADSGPNGLQNFPVITPLRGGLTTVFDGTLDSTPNSTFTIDFYAGSAADPSGHGEGQRYLGSTSVTTDALGRAEFSASLGSTMLGEWITATATGVEGTSEFSRAETITNVVQPVEIDILTGQVNLESNAVIKVAVLTTASFNAATIDVPTVVFAGASATASELRDIDGDGDFDLVLSFHTGDTNLLSLYVQLLEEDQDEDGVLDATQQVAEVTLTGQTVDQVLIEGSDTLTLFLKGKKLRDLLKALFG